MHDGGHHDRRCRGRRRQQVAQAGQPLRCRRGRPAELTVRHQVRRGQGVQPRDGLQGGPRPGPLQQPDLRGHSQRATHHAVGAVLVADRPPQLVEGYVAAGEGG